MMQLNVTVDPQEKNNRLLILHGLPQIKSRTMNENVEDDYLGTHFVSDEDGLEFSVTNTQLTIFGVDLTQIPITSIFRWVGGRPTSGNDLNKFPCMPVFCQALFIFELSLFYFHLILQGLPIVCFNFMCDTIGGRVQTFSRSTKSLERKIQD